MTPKRDAHDQILINDWCIRGREDIRAQMVNEETGVNGGAMVDTEEALVRTEDDQ